MSLGGLGEGRGGVAYMCDEHISTGLTSAERTCVRDFVVGPTYYD